MGRPLRQGGSSRKSLDLELVTRVRRTRREFGKWFATHIFAYDRQFGALPVKWNLQIIVKWIIIGASNFKNPCHRGDLALYGQQALRRPSNNSITTKTVPWTKLLLSKNTNTPCSWIGKMFTRLNLDMGIDWKVVHFHQIYAKTYPKGRKVDLFNVNYGWVDLFWSRNSLDYICTNCGQFGTRIPQWRVCDCHDFFGKTCLHLSLLTFQKRTLRLISDFTTGSSIRPG